MENVLLTGGAGYIGSHIAVELLEAGYDVTVADDFSNSSPRVLERVEKITGKKVRLFELDVSDKEKLRALFEAVHVDSVVH